MTPAVLLAIYCGLVVCAAFAGGWLPQRIKLTHVRQQLIVSFVGGLMLGVALLHLLPHSFYATGSVDRTAGGTLIGVLVIFALLRAFHSHHHSVADEPGVPLCGHPQHVHQHGSAAAVASTTGLPIVNLAEASTDAPHSHEHGHSHPHGHHHHGHASHELSWVGLVLGFGVHTIIDGMALGASVYGDAAHLGVPGLWGLATFLAVFLHKPLDAASISLVMGAGGWSKRARLIVTAVFSMMCPLGALLFVLGLQQFGEGQELVVGTALAFSAGAFLCIALSDLLPEIEFHGHDRVKLSLLLLTGVAIAWAVGFLEPAHVHAPHSGPTESAHDHSHDHAH